MHKVNRRPKDPGQDICMLMIEHLIRRGGISEYEGMCRVFGRQAVDWLVHPIDGNTVSKIDILVKHTDNSKPSKHVPFVVTDKWNGCKPKDWLPPS